MPRISRFSRCGARTEEHTPDWCSFVTDSPHSHFYRSAVPRRLKRYYGHGDLHYITCSCYHRQPWLGSARRRDLFLRILEQVRLRYSLVVVGYVVMPEHFHLLISEPQRGTPSTVMQAVKLGFARRVLAAMRGLAHL